MGAPSHRGTTGQRGRLRARSLAKRCGNATSPALTAAKMPLPFTRREYEVVTLLSNGLSNRDIAQAMSLSVRTVSLGLLVGSTTVTGGSTVASGAAAVA